MIITTLGLLGTVELKDAPPLALWRTLLHPLPLSVQRCHF